MVYFATFIIFTASFMLAYGILITLNHDKMLVKKRMEQVIDSPLLNIDNLENKSFSDRALMPFYRFLCSFLMKATTISKLESLNKRLEGAGMLKNSTVEKWLYTKTMVTIIISVLIGLLSYIAEPDALKAIIFVVLIIILVNVLFNFYVSKRIEKRRRKILKDLPYTLDLITVSVEAGLSFDGAMARVVSNISGELCDEFSKSLKEIRMGIQRKVALRNMSQRCNVKELSMLVTALIQADDLGVSLSRVLRIEAANLRELKKQLAREKAMKAPIKMLFPLIFFIFPSIFIIILGPAVIRIINIFVTK